MDKYTLQLIKTLLRPAERHEAAVAAAIPELRRAYQDAVAATHCPGATPAAEEAGLRRLVRDAEALSAGLHSLITIRATAQKLQVLLASPISSRAAAVPWLTEAGRTIPLVGAGDGDALRRIVLTLAMQLETGCLTHRDALIGRCQQVQANSRPDTRFWAGELVVVLKQAGCVLQPDLWAMLAPILASVLEVGDV